MAPGLEQPSQAAADEEMKEEEKTVEVKEEEDKKEEASENEKEMMNDSQPNEESSYEEPLDDKLVLNASYSEKFDNSIKTAELLLVLVTKQVTAGDTLDIDVLTEESFDLLIKLRFGA